MPKVLVLKYLAAPLQAIAELFRSGALVSPFDAVRMSVIFLQHCARAPVANFVLALQRKEAETLYQGPKT
jgi:hypothetical protein